MVHALRPRLPIDFFLVRDSVRVEGSFVPGFEASGSSPKPAATCVTISRYLPSKLQQVTAMIFPTVSISVSISQEILHNYY